METNTCGSTVTSFFGYFAGYFSAFYLWNKANTVSNILVSITLGNPEKVKNIRKRSARKKEEQYVIYWPHLQLSWFGTKRL